jgi:hypothetical protein
LRRYTPQTGRIGGPPLVRQPCDSRCRHSLFFQGFSQASWNLGTPPLPQFVRSKPFAPGTGITSSIRSVHYRPSRPKGKEPMRFRAAPRKIRGRPRSWSSRRRRT